MTAGFKNEFDVRLGPDGLWLHLDDVVWEGSDGDRAVVPKGRSTDFASVPRIAQALLPSADPRVVRAAAVHDELCRELDRFYRGVREWLMGLDLVKITGEDRYRRPYPERPAFNSVDADAVFEKIMRDEGAGWWMTRVGWVGVRLGALWNPARRSGWLSTAPRVIGLSTVFLAAALALLAPLAGLVWLVAS